MKTSHWIIVFHDTIRSETNGTAERAVRRIKVGTSGVLLQSGLDEKWWADSVACCCSSAKKCPRPSGRWDSVWCHGWISSYFCGGAVKAPPIWVRKFYLVYLHCSRGEILARRYLWSQTLRRWENMDASEIRPSKNQRERSIDNTKKGRRIHVHSSRWNSKIVRKG